MLKKSALTPEFKDIIAARVFCKQRGYDRIMGLVDAAILMDQASTNDWYLVSYINDQIGQAQGAAERGLDPTASTCIEFLTYWREHVKARALARVTTAAGTGRARVRRSA